METAIRWSPHSTEQDSRFLIIDVARNRLQLCQLENVDGRKCKYTQLSVRDKLPNFTAFDWSKTSESYVAVGSASGEAVFLSIAQDGPQADFITSFPIKHQRKCNSIAFSARDWLATGLDRVRNDFCMNIYDINQATYTQQQEPLRKLASSEIINSIKFFNQRPDVLVAGVSRQGVRIYDLRGKSWV
jgi:WD repeat-containing protein mio